MVNIQSGHNIDEGHNEYLHLGLLSTRLYLWHVCRGYHSPTPHFLLILPRWPMVSFPHIPRHDTSFLSRYHRGTFARLDAASLLPWFRASHATAAVVDPLGWQRGQPYLRPKNKVANLLLLTTDFPSYLQGLRPSRLQKRLRHRKA